MAWPFNTPEYSFNRPRGIDAPMNYQDQIRFAPGGNYQGWQDRIMDTDLMVNEQWRNTLDDINTNPRYDDTTISIRQKGEPFFAENRGNILENIFDKDVNWRGYQRRPDDFNINKLGLASIFQPNEQMEAAIDEIQETGSFGGQKYVLDEDRNKIYSEVNPFGKNLRSWKGSADPTAMDDKTLAWAMDRLSRGKAISTRLRNILQNRGMLNVTGTDRIGGDPSIPIGPIDTGGYTGPPTRDFDPGIAARTTHWSERPGTQGGFIDPGKGSYGPWKAEGGRVGYATGELVDEDVNIAGPGFDVNENVMMASDDNNTRILENLFDKYIDLGFSPKEAEKMAMDEFELMSQGPEQDQGLASLV